MLNSAEDSRAKDPAQPALESKYAEGDQHVVLVVDDHPAVCEAMVETINSHAGLDARAYAQTADEAKRLLDELQPDVVTIDLLLKQSHGLDLVRYVHEHHPDVRVVVFSMCDECAYAERAIRAGASAYVMKTESTENVVRAIRRVLAGGIYLSRRSASNILARSLFGLKSVESRFGEEFTGPNTFLRLFDDGHSSEEILAQLSEFGALSDGSEQPASNDGSLPPSSILGLVNLLSGAAAKES